MPSTYRLEWKVCASLKCYSRFRARTKVVLVKVVSCIIYYSPEMIYIYIYMVYIHIPLISLHKYRSVYEHNRLFRKPPLLGPPLSCAKHLIRKSTSQVSHFIRKFTQNPPFAKPPFDHV